MTTTAHDLLTRIGRHTSTPQLDELLIDAAMWLDDWGNADDLAANLLTRHVTETFDGPWATMPILYSVAANGHLLELAGTLNDLAQVRINIDSETVSGHDGACKWTPEGGCTFCIIDHRDALEQALHGVKALLSNRALHDLTVVAA